MIINLHVLFQSQMKNEIIFPPFGCACVGTYSIFKYTHMPWKIDNAIFNESAVLGVQII